jgi:hypothetical protein
LVVVASALGIAAAALSGCANTAAVADEGANIEYSPSADRAAALADGLVDRAEYRAGFERFRACMTESGYTVDVLDDSGTIIDARYLSEATDDGTDARCYDTEFREVDESWQVAHQDERTDGALLDACLRENGLVVPETRHEKVMALAEAGVDFGSCLGEE